MLRWHHPLGVSTGYMAGLRGNWDAQISAARKVSSFAIELSVLSETELPSLWQYLSRGREWPFRYISVHGPSKDRELDEKSLVAQLVKLAKWADGIVMHPDTIQSSKEYLPLGRKLILENLDSRKSTGRTADELAPFFKKLPEARFCFDIAHAWSIDDGEMIVAGELLDRLGERLQHVHLSSLSLDLHHVPLTAEHQELFRPFLARCVDVPWILEAPPLAA
jgi:hypothetical protein